MKITGSYFFFSLNQECLRDSAMTSDFSESVQCYSLEKHGEGGRLLQCFIKTRLAAPFPRSQDHKRLVIEAFSQLVSTSTGGGGSELIV